MLIDTLVVDAKGFVEPGPFSAGGCLVVQSYCLHELGGPLEILPVMAGHSVRGNRTESDQRTMRSGAEVNVNCVHRRMMFEQLDDG